MSENVGWNLRSDNEYGSSVYSQCGKEVAFFSAYDSAENALKRAELFCSAPKIFEALCDVVSLCDKELPEHLKSQLNQSRELLNALRR